MRRPVRSCDEDDDGSKRELVWVLFLPVPYGELPNWWWRSYATKDEAADWARNLLVGCSKPDGIGTGFAARPCWECEGDTWRATETTSATLVLFLSIVYAEDWVRAGGGSRAQSVKALERITKLCDRAAPHGGATDSAFRTFAANVEQVIDEFMPVSALPTLKKQEEIAEIRHLHTTHTTRLWPSFMAMRAGAMWRPPTAAVATKRTRDADDDAEGGAGSGEGAGKVARQ